MTYLVSSLQSASSLYISFGVLFKLVSLLVVTGEKLIPCLTDKEVKISRARLHCFLPSFSTNNGEFCSGRFPPAGVRVFPAGNLQNPQEILTKTLIIEQIL